MRAPGGSLSRQGLLSMPAPKTTTCLMAPTPSVGSACRQSRMRLSNHHVCSVMRLTLSVRFEPGGAACARRGSMSIRLKPAGHDCACLMLLTILQPPLRLVHIHCNPLTNKIDRCNRYLGLLPGSVGRKGSGQGLGQLVSHQWLGLFILQSPPSCGRMRG